MTGIIIPCYNRPEYLQRCLESVAASDLSGCVVLLMDDGSTNKETVRLINDYALTVPLIKLMASENSGVKAVLSRGFELLFNYGCEIVINLDSDAIVKPDWVKVLLKLKHSLPDYIVSGFNSKNTDNKGQLRNPIHKEADNYLLKKHCNGINMCLNKQDYEKHIKPALQKEGNWDFNSTNKDGFIISKPSVVQHIGLKSSMGHNDNPDVACDFKLLSLPTVTLFGIDAHDPAGLRKAANICLNDVEFGAVNIITEHNYFRGREGYSEFCIKNMAEHVDTDHVLIIHPDGYILNPSAWSNDFLQYDYIGATWWYKDNKNVGNGGFSLRSKKLLDILANLDLDRYHPEDDIICRGIRPYLDEQGIKFAPEEVANRFSIEAYGVQDNRYNGAFGFHGKHVDFTGSGLPHIPSFPIQRPISNRPILNRRK